MGSFPISGDSVLLLVFAADEDDVVVAVVIVVVPPGLSLAACLGKKSWPGIKPGSSPVFATVFVGKTRGDDFVFVTI